MSAETKTYEDKMTSAITANSTTRPTAEVITLVFIAMPRFAFKFRRSGGCGYCILQWPGPDPPG